MRATASWRSMLPLSAPRMRCMPCFLPQRTCLGATSAWPLTRAFSAVLAHHRFRWRKPSSEAKVATAPAAPKDDRELTIAVTHPGSYASHAVCITCRAPHGLGVVHLAWEWPHLCCRLLYRPPFALVIGPPRCAVVIPPSCGILALVHPRIGSCLPPACAHVHVHHPAIHLARMPQRSGRTDGQLPAPHRHRHVSVRN